MMYVLNQLLISMLPPSLLLISILLYFFDLFLIASATDAAVLSYCSKWCELALHFIIESRTCKPDIYVPSISTDNYIGIGMVYSLTNL